MAKISIKQLETALTQEQQQLLSEKAAHESAKAQQYDVAIIGLNGRYPQSDSHYDFWAKLLKGANLIQEIPLSRWDHSEYYDPQAGKSFVPHKTRCKYGAFLNSYDKFDGDFFGLHSDEVFFMDPQERIALETTWSCIEDAGYTAKKLNGEVGVFSGLTYNEYQKLIPGVSHSCMLSNRIAYFFNFQGPAITLDAGCCSSLTAIHLACQSILRRDCNTAVVIGSNLILHPDHYTMISPMLSPKSEAYSNPFGTDEGWVPAEGVVSILLKPLKQAVYDRDHIYGIIKSSHICQEGKTSWFTAPNPKQQARLIRENFEKSGINPETIGYAEAAANGSALGDAIEIEGMTAAFSQFTDKKQFCPIGTVKANAGHGEAVSTLMQLTKVLLQFKSRTIIPLINLKEVNPNISMESSPFYFQKSAGKWEAPTVKLNGEHVVELPRRATISSFGAGGNIGHLILEEYAADSINNQKLNNYYIPISSNTQKQLRQMIESYIEFFKSYRKFDFQCDTNYTLLNIMFTLCTGREAFNERVVFIADSLDTLINQFHQYLRGESSPDIISSIHEGTVGLSDGDSQKVKSCIEKLSWHNLGALWVQGIDISWGTFFDSYNAGRVPLPTCCFNRQSFSMPDAADYNPTDFNYVEEAALIPAESEIQDGSKNINIFKEIFSKLLNTPINKIDLNTPLENYGFDSVMVILAAKELERYFDKVPKTLFFECQTIQDIIDYFNKKCPNKALKSTAVSKSPVQNIKARSRTERMNSSFKKASSNDIAIIGLSGRYPQAKNINEFWRNLREGRDCISEIPPDRWKWQDYFHPDRKEAARLGKSYSKWGGFLDDIDKFDPLFFNISPREAEFMDPQERLFLETAWEALEDAGYSRTSLKAERADGKPVKVGVFAGASWQEYQFYSSSLDKSMDNILSNNICNISNRVSYFCDFRGSSLTVDTACSSSLTAIHLACMSLIQGANAMAIAGGVNLSLHPNKYLSLSMGQFVSTKGRCESFGEGGDGYISSEGVGCIVLKPLERAVVDGDNIYGIIKGTAINHGGKTNGYTVPNPNAQAEVIEEALNEAGINPRTISYIEAHGTGTSLGDPIEIAGLSKAFCKYTSDKQFCAIGSAKSNIGHCESAAGIAGITKILLQLKYRQLVPSLHSKVLNPNIDFADSPFVVQQSIEEWKRPTVNINGEAKEYPRRAGISSFGAGGSNAHIIIEEYIPEGIEKARVHADTENPAIIVLSGKDEERLKEQAQHLLTAIQEQRLSEADLEDMAYTLQIGREAMEARMAVITSSIKDLEEKLKCYVEAMGGISDVYIGQVKHNRDTIAVFSEDEDMKKTIDAWIMKGKYSKLAELWVKGMPLDWSKFYGDMRPRRISLPTYPFARERCWIADQKASKKSSYKESKPISKSSGDLLSDAVEYIKQILSEVLKLNPEKLDSDTGFDEIGLDSIIIGQIHKRLEEAFGEIPLTIFFTYKNIISLAQYFIKEHHENAISFFNKQGIIDTVEYEAVNTGNTDDPNDEPEGEDRIAPEKEKCNVHENWIAVIGISGQYPQADNLDRFWDNLVQGKDCIVEIPKERWDYKKYYNEEANKDGKSGGMYCRWGGFMEDVDKFDPFFFNIAPIDARFMDPQERLFLQTAWACFEDAGYSRKLMENKYGGDGRAPVGVFAGVTFNNYQLNVASEWQNGNLTPISSQIFSVANRVSYILNLSGPSLSVDTACSSSLYAVHLACESIRRGECDMALAGGVNLTLHPSKYVTLCSTQFASSDGHCRAFGADGDGYVPGEGVGAVLLKPYEKAVADKDHIYAVIKGTAVNHDGKTYGYSVPNPVAQTEVIDAAIKMAGINPRSISYVEAHGTGTKLGDPIEIRGLSDAYGKYTKDKKYCSIGSVKSNIGHLESAAGIAQLTKVILQMKHKKLVPNLLHSERTNPSIDFENTPFYVQRVCEEWKVPQNSPRRAGISSFGAGGVNVHIVLEEYKAPLQNIEQKEDNMLPAIIVLSAKKENNLRVYAKQLKNYLETKGGTENIRNIAYTLQSGRETMDFRLAFTSSDADAAIGKLDMFINLNADEKSGIYFGHAAEKSIDTEDISLETLYNDKKMEEIAKLWARGKKVNWEKLYSDYMPSRVHLPTYPFSKERYWIEGASASFENGQAVDSIKQKQSTEPKISIILSKLCDALDSERPELLEQYIQNVLAELLAFNPPDLPELQQGFFDMGMESVMVAKFQSLLEENLNIKISDSAVFDYPNIVEISKYILSIIPFEELESQTVNNESDSEEAVLLKELSASASDDFSEDCSMSIEDVASELRSLLEQLNT